MLEDGGLTSSRPSRTAGVALASSCMGLGGGGMVAYTRVPPVRLLGPVCWRMLGGPPADTSRTSGAPLASSWRGLGGGRMVASLPASSSFAFFRFGLTTRI